MPFITVKMLEGRTQDQKRRIVEGVTRVVADACGLPAERIHVFLEDMSTDAYARGGQLWCDRPPEPK